MEVTIKLFAFLQDQLGPSITVDLPQLVTIDEIFAAVSKLAPTLKPTLANSRLAINQEFIDQPQVTIKPTDEVAIIPPVSGG